MKRYDYFHSDDPVEAAKFVVSEAVAALWESVLRHDGFAALADRAPEQLIRWEADYGWTRRGYGQVAEKETRPDGATGSPGTAPHDHLTYQIHTISLPYRTCFCLAGHAERRNR